MSQILPVLSPRLALIAGLVPKCGCFADIGTDHAYLPVYLSLCGRCKTAVASDIGKGPISRARQTIKKYKADELVSVRLGPGLDTLCCGEADVISIAGMGGLIIAEILEKGVLKLGRIKKIILQPMSSVPDLREYLWKNGWNIDGEYLAAEDKKIYNILVVSRQNKPLDFLPCDMDIFLGRALLENRPNGFFEYIASQADKFDKIVKGLKISESEESEAKIEKYRNLLINTNKILTESREEVKNVNS